jgi:hypothetical protein
LVTEAAGRGLLREYDPFDYRRVSQTYLLLRWLTDTLHREAAAAVHDRTLAFVPLFRGRGAEQLFRIESSQFHNLQKLNPVVFDKGPETAADVVSTAKSAWEAAFGVKMNDPAVRTQIETLCNSMLCPKPTNQTSA